jgi:acetyl esterase/lipase
MSIWFTLAALVGIPVTHQQDYLVRAYKQVGTDSLVVHVFSPAEPGRHPAVILFHGGGFAWGGPENTHGTARDYRARGLVALAAQYRLANRATVTPIEQVEDALDVIRWVRAHAAELRVDPSRIVAEGVSAGGFLAAMAAGSADAAARPNFLVLWSPGIGAGEGEADDDPYWIGLFGGRPLPADFGPRRRVRSPMPATIILSGQLDSVTYEFTARRYCTQLEAARARCEFYSWPSLGHLLSRRLDARSQREGQFDVDPEVTRAANEKVYAFLASQGVLKY